MSFRKTISVAALAILMPLAAMAAPVPALDDPNTVITVMQFSAKSPAVRPELMKRMAAIRDFIRKQPGYIDNALMENRNPNTQPSFVGVSRWKSFKDWEAIWSKPELQKLVAATNEVGDVTPGTFAPIK